MDGGHITAPDQASPGVEEFWRTRDVGDGAEAQHQQGDIEITDKERCIVGGELGLAHIRHGEQAHEDVGQPDCPEQHGYLNREYLNRVIEDNPGAQYGLTLGMGINRLAQQTGEAEARIGQQQYGDQGHAEQQ